MITQDFINGYIQALNNLEFVYNQELKNCKHCSQKEIILSHIENIQNIKESYKLLIKKLNNNKSLP